MADAETTDTTTARHFIAIPLPNSICEGLLTAQSALRASDARVSWVPEDNLHLSLAFLGKVPENILETLTTGLAQLAAKHSTFTLTLSSIGTFGRPRKPRVIWAGCEPSDSLMQLQSEVAAYARTQGIDVDGREFRPHITLGRVRAAEGLPELLDIIDQHAETAFGAFDVEGIVLFQSVLESSQAVHAPLLTCDLA